MIRIVQYKCGVCGFTDTDRSRVVACECSHMGITPEDLAEWKKLKEIARYCSKAYNTQANAQTDKAFDDAIGKLLEFERAHNLTETRMPDLL